MEVLLAHFAAADAFLLQQYFGENDNPKQPELKRLQRIGQNWRVWYLD